MFRSLGFRCLEVGGQKQKSVISTERRNLIKNDIVTLSSFGVSRSVSKCELREYGVSLVTLRYNPDKSGSLHPSFYYGMAGRVTAEDKGDVD
jgi:hypothetical protein